MADSEDVDNFAKGLEARNPWESVAVECSGYAAGLKLWMEITIVVKELADHGVPKQEWQHFKKRSAGRLDMLIVFS